MEKKDYKPPEVFWPIFGDGEALQDGGASFEETPAEMIDNIMKAHGIKSVPGSMKKVVEFKPPIING